MQYTVEVDLKQSVVLFMLLISLVYGTSFYVSPTGNDTNPGTFEAPFQTIATAVTHMQSGDICLLRQGSYREEFDLSKRSGLTFQPYNGEAVTISGVKELNLTWAREEGSIYSAALTDDIWQLFVDREMVVSARWPNAQLQDNTLFDIKQWAVADSGSPDGTFTDSDKDNHSLADLNVDITGAIGILNFGKWVTQARIITGHTAGSATATYELFGDDYRPVSPLAPHLYYLEGKREFLDSENEWFYNPDTKRIYLWAPEGKDPSGLTIEGKVQTYAFRGDTCDNITFRELHFFGTTVGFKQSHHITIDSCDFDYPSYSKRMLGDLSEPEVAEMVQRLRVDESSCIVRNSNFSYTDGPALRMGGADNLVEENLFEYVDYSVTTKWGFTLDMLYSFNLLFRRNSIYMAGASEGLRVTTSQKGYQNIVELNHFSHLGMLQNDGANIQLHGKHEAGNPTIIRYNWLHDTPKIGIRCDGEYFNGNNFKNALIHHNVIWNAAFVGLNPKGDSHQVYNNTVFNCGRNSIVIWAENDSAQINSITRNNASDDLTGKQLKEFPIPSINSHNITGDIPSFLVDPDNFDFTPKAGSPLVDAGTVVAGISDDYIGSAPDAGAYERGGEYWIPGITRDTAVVALVHTTSLSPWNRGSIGALQSIGEKMILSFTLPKADNITVKLYSLTGRELYTASLGDLQSGLQQITFQEEWGSSVVVVRIDGNETAMRRILLLE